MNMLRLAPTLLAGLLFGAVAVVWTYPLARDPSRLAAIAYDQSERSPHESAGGWGPIRYRFCQRNPAQKGARNIKKWARYMYNRSRSTVILLKQKPFVPARVP